jgi:RNA polymerase sigma factor (sigma-70 family)
MHGNPSGALGEALSPELMVADQDQRIAEAIAGDQARLRNFIRRRVPDEAEVEDILQDVFYELVEAYRLMKPLQQVSAWLFRVARNRIIDAFRKRTTEARADFPAAPGERESESANEPAPQLEDLLPSPDAGPEATYARGVLIDEIEDALNELPAEQREVFIAHEIEGRSFKEIAAKTGVSVSTLLSRKHYAVLHLRERLAEIHDEFTNSGGTDK